MKIHEALARQIVLAQAVETADDQGKLISDVERDQIDAGVAKEARSSVDANADAAPALGALLAQRASLLLDLVEGRNRAIASLQKAPSLQHAMAWVLPVGALILGVVVDRVFNPSRVDLLSESFLGVLVWNVVVYALIVLSIFRRSPRQAIAWIESLRHLAAGMYIWRRARNALGADIALQFSTRWQALTAPLARQRLLHMMHLAAAAWGAGVALSLILRGTVRAYTVGWESTLLNAQQVHFVLSILSWPLVQIFGIAPFTTDDVARLQFDIGLGAIGKDGSRWLWMYVGLLLVIVVLPRLALAGLSAWRARQLAKVIDIDIDAAYFQRIVDNLSPATVRLGLLTHRVDDQNALQQVLIQEPSSHTGRSALTSCKLLATERGDALWTADVASSHAPQTLSFPVVAAKNSADKKYAQNWRKWLGAANAVASPDASFDLVLHVVSQVQDLVAALPVLQGLQRPVLILVRSSGLTEAMHAELLDQCRLHQRNHDLSMDILDFEAFACCWVQDRALLDAIARHVPRARTQGFARLINAWEQRSQKRFMAAVDAIVEALNYAARQFEEIPKLSLLDRVSPERRQAHAIQEQAAMQAVLERVKLQDHAYVQTLLSLHGLAPDSANALALSGKFSVQTAVSAPRAAMGGAASGAALGASIDMLTGGLTLGAAAALGALAGGSFAFAGALWNNRAAPNGGTRVSLSDDMLLALAQACLVRYLAVIHLHRDSYGVEADARQEAWNTEVFAELPTHTKQILPLLENSRKGDAADGGFATLTAQIVRHVLQRLYPAARF